MMFVMCNAALNVDAIVLVLLAKQRLVALHHDNNASLLFGNTLKTQTSNLHQWKEVLLQCC